MIILHWQSKFYAKKVSKKLWQGGEACPINNAGA